MSFDYKSVEFELHEYLIQLQNMLVMLKADPELIEKIERNKELIKNKKYTIAVMGAFKTGKSSLINALIGDKILPADATPATATINRITYGTDSKAVICYKDNTDETIEISQLTDYVTKLTDEGEARALRIKEAIVYSPIVLCQNHVDIIDTPGLNDDEKMTAITLDMISKTDGVILTIHAKSPYGETENKFVCDLIKSKSVYNIIFVVTFLDQLDEDEYEYDRFMNFISTRIREKVFSQLEKDKVEPEIIERAHQMLDEIHIFGLSAYKALKSFINNDKKMLTESRFEVFKHNLLKIITSKQVENAYYKTVDNIRAVSDELDKIKTLETGETEKKLDDFYSGLEKLQNYCKNTRSLSDKKFYEIHKKTQFFYKKLYRLKNNLAKNFLAKIQPLSSSEEIADAIVHESNMNESEVINNHLNDLKTKLIAEYTDNLKTFLEMRKIDFPQELKETEPELTDNFIMDIQPEMSEKIISKWTKLNFSWNETPNLNAIYQKHHSPLSFILTNIDNSINKIISGSETLAAELRKELTAFFREDAGKTCKIGEHFDNDKRDAIEMTIKTRQGYIQVFSQTVKEILNKSEDFWSNFVNEK